MRVTLRVKVVPGASASKIAGWLGRELKVRVSTPPENGKANQNVERLIAKHLDLPAKHVRIVKGHTSAHKTIELEGIDQSTLFNTFGKPGP